MRKACRAIVDLVKRHRITSFANADIRKPRAPLSFRRVITISPSRLGWNVLKAVSAMETSGARAPKRTHSASGHVQLTARGLRVLALVSLGHAAFRGMP